MKANSILHDVVVTSIATFVCVVILLSILGIFNPGNELPQASVVSPAGFDSGAVDDLIQRIGEVAFKLEKRNASLQVKRTNLRNSNDVSLGKTDLILKSIKELKDSINEMSLLQASMHAASQGGIPPAFRVAEKRFESLQGIFAEYIANPGSYEKPYLGKSIHGILERFGRADGIHAAKNGVKLYYHLDSSRMLEIQCANGLVTHFKCVVFQ